MLEQSCFSQGIFWGSEMPLKVVFLSPPKMVSTKSLSLKHSYRRQRSSRQISRDTVHWKLIYVSWLGKSKGGLSKRGLSPKGTNWAQKGPFGGIPGASPRLWGAEESVPISPEKAPTDPEKAPIGPEKARFSRKEFFRETLCESGRWVDALKKRGRVLKKRGGFLRRGGGS